MNPEIDEKTVISYKIFNSVIDFEQWQLSDEYRDGFCRIISVSPLTKEADINGRQIGDAPDIRISQSVEYDIRVFVVFHIYRP